MSQICCECGQNPGIYRCPQCHSFYCCVNCSKIHKTHCPGKIEDEPKKEENKELSPFELFRSHKSVMDALSDKRLQDIIKRIDSAEDREQELINELERNKSFKDFVDDMMNHLPKGIEP